MDRIEALRTAIDLVDNRSIPKKENGDPIDGWRASSPADRHVEIMAYAEFLIKKRDEE